MAAPSGDEFPSGEFPSDDAQWVPAYSKVSGELPSEDFPTGDRILARGFLNVQVAGGLRLDINETAGLRIWFDGLEMANPSDTIELEKGRRTVTFVIDRAKRGNAGLRVELVAPPGSAVKFQLEGGI